MKFKRKFSDCTKKLQSTNLTPTMKNTAGVRLNCTESPYFSPLISPTNHPDFRPISAPLFPLADAFGGVTDLGGHRHPLETPWDAVEYAKKHLVEADFKVCEAFLRQWQNVWESCAEFFRAYTITRAADERHYRSWFWDNYRRKPGLLTAGNNSVDKKV